jgi:hypothetical protein
MFLGTGRPVVFQHLNTGYDLHDFGPTTGFTSVPIPSYVHDRESPALKYTGGFFAEPTPGGVPVGSKNM